MLIHMVHGVLLQQSHTTFSIPSLKLIHANTTGYMHDEDNTRVYNIYIYLIVQNFDGGKV